MIPNSRGNGTSQIDHLVVFPSGIAVIETKNWAGRVYGSGADRRWTVTLGRRKYHKESPVLQNKGHIDALQRILGENVPMYNIIVLGRAELRLNDISGAVVIRPRQIAPTILGLNRHIWNDEQVRAIHQRLVDMNITDANARKQHVENIRRKYR